MIFLSIYRSFYLPIYLPVCLSIFISIYLSFFLVICYLSIFLFIHRLIYLSDSHFFYFLICKFFYSSTCQTIYLAIYFLSYFYISTLYWSPFFFLLHSSLHCSLSFILRRSLFAFISFYHFNYLASPFSPLTSLSSYTHPSPFLSLTHSLTLYLFHFLPALLLPNDLCRQFSWKPKYLTENVYCLSLFSFLKNVRLDRLSALFTRTWQGCFFSNDTTEPVVVANKTILVWSAGTFLLPG